MVDYNWNSLRHSKKFFFVNFLWEFDGFVILKINDFKRILPRLFIFNWKSFIYNKRDLVFALFRSIKRKLQIMAFNLFKFILFFSFILKNFESTVNASAVDHPFRMHVLYLCMKCMHVKKVVHCASVYGKLHFFYLTTLQLQYICNMFEMDLWNACIILCLSEDC